MRILFFILYCGYFMSTFAQQDTIVVTDYTKVMVGTEEKGEPYPITFLEGVQQTGFFINGQPDGKVRICHSEELFVWVNGKLFDVINDCSFYDPDELFEKANSDTIFVSLSSDKPLSNVTCELVVFEEQPVIKDQVSIPREVRSEFREFTIIALLLLLLLLGVIVSTYPARISYLIKKSFTLKVSAYEFVNTGFFSGASMYLLGFYSLALAFSGVYLDGLLKLGLFEISTSVWESLSSWIQFAGGIFLLFVVKWEMISIVAGLFRFRGLKNFQLFDFLNFNVVLLIPMLLFLVLDFILNSSSHTWVPSGFVKLFPTMLVLFVVWFTFKFVNNSICKKLIIISYLCTTEIIPLIILLRWFFK